MSEFSAAAREIASWLPALCIFGVFLERTIKGIKEKKEKEKMQSPQRNVRNPSVCSPEPR